MGALFGLLPAIGLATATGLNAFLPLFTVGLLARFNLIHLNPPFDWLSHPLVLLIIAALAVLDFVGDKVPTVDNALHALGLIIHPIAGAILFVAANSAIGAVHPILAMICGIVLAGLTHLLRTAVRPVVTTATAGTATPVLSIIEDIVALLLSVLAVVVPILAGLLVLGLIGGFVWFLTRMARPWRDSEPGNNPPTPQGVE
jgi:hypothetical protein